jgi:hypothetical protein
MKKFKSFYEEMTFKVEVEGLPALFMSGNSPGQVKNHLRKLIKQPSMIKSVERKTKHDVKKMYRAKAQGKDLEENYYRIDHGKAPKTFSGNQSHGRDDSGKEIKGVYATHDKHAMGHAYAVPRETPWVFHHHNDGQKHLYIHKDHEDKVENHTATLSKFHKSSGFRGIDGGDEENVSKKNEKPHTQTKIKSADHIRKQGIKIHYVDHNEFKQKAKQTNTDKSLKMGGNENVTEGTMGEVLDTPEKRKEYIKKASQSNYSAAQKFARVAASPTSRKYKNKEMDRLDNIGRKRKAGLAMVNRKKQIADQNELGERTPVRPTVQDPKLKNLRVPNPNYKGLLKRKEKTKRAIYNDVTSEGTMGNKPEWGTPESTRKAKKMTPGETCENNCGCDKCKRKMDEKLTIGKIRRAAYKTGKVLGDVQAVKKGKVARRVKNRILGKMVGKALSGLWK